MLSGGVKNSWNWNFAIFRDLVLISSEAFYKKSVLNDFSIFTGKHLWQNLLLSCNLIQEEALGPKIFLLILQDF